MSSDREKLREISLKELRKGVARLRQTSAAQAARMPARASLASRRIFASDGPSAVMTAMALFMTCSDMGPVAVAVGQ